MIGAGIFLLSGIAITMAGPAAIFSYMAAGVVCIITAASAAELATGMPTSGGDYFFVSRSLGPSFGAISGVGIWLSLTFAIAFYLIGMGEYLSEFLPIAPIWGGRYRGYLANGTQHCRSQRVWRYAGYCCPDLDCYPGHLCCRCHI